MHIFIYFEEGNGNPLQCPCLGNAMDREACHMRAHPQIGQLLLKDHLQFKGIGSNSHLPSQKCALAEKNIGSFLFFKMFFCGSFLKSLFNLLQYCFCFMFWLFVY